LVTGIDADRLTQLSRAGRPANFYYVMFDWLARVSFINQIYLVVLLLDIGLIGWRYAALPTNLRPLLWLVITNLIVELITDYIKSDTEGNNLYVYHLYAPVEYGILAAIFFRSFQESLIRKCIFISVVSYVIIVIISSLFWEPLTQNNSITYMIESVLVIGWSGLYFRTLLRVDSLYRPETDPTFWVLTALLIYFAGTFFTIGLLNYFIATNKALASLLYYGTYPFVFILYVTIGLTMLLLPAQLAHHDD
jgi:hypothetical protein